VSLRESWPACVLSCHGFTGQLRPWRAGGRAV